jgi:hypothetical protein
VIGKIAVRTALGQGKRYSEYCTTSDETMALLVYDNNYDNWLDKANHKTNNTQPTIIVKQRFFNECKGKGNTYNIEGRKYYNKMNRMCLEHRMNRGDEFDKKFHEHLHKAKIGNKNNINGKRKKWDDDPDDEANYHRIVITKDLNIYRDRDICLNATNQTDV